LEAETIRRIVTRRKRGRRYTFKSGYDIVTVILQQHPLFASITIPTELEVAMKKAGFE
jgi:hypothetical protein